MDWLWPDLFLLLGFIPLIVAIYVLILRRRYRFAGRYSSLSLVRAAGPNRSWLQRHLPFVLLIVAVISLIAALGRPTIPADVLSGRTTIILALDVSTSMCMRDIVPNRLEAAKTAARSFVQEPVPGTQLGIVVFGGFAELAQAPTTEVALLERTIENLTTMPRTAIGSAILRSLDAIAEVDKRIPPSKNVATPPAGVQPLPPPGDDVPHIIVLLTDGASNTGPAPLDAAQQAAERGVRVYTIGFGTTQNAIMDCWSDFDDELFGRPGSKPQPGGNFGSEPDEATLKQIAALTGGKFYSATSATELQMVFQDLRTYVAATNQMIEVSVFFVAIAAVLSMAALILALLWHPLL